jgi:hypothetical protein
MKIAKPMLLVTTPIGVGLGIYEGFRLAGGLVFLMIALLSLISVAFGTLVATVRREKREELARDAAARTAHATLPEKAGPP